MISGTFFKHRCRYRYSHYSDARDSYFATDELSGIDAHFVKTEHLPILFEYGFSEPIVLVTHNSDVNISNRLAELVLSRLPIKLWYAQNLDYDHPLIKPIPIGIANPKWEHGKVERFKQVISSNIPKSQILHCDFNISTNPTERRYCLEQTGLSVKNYPPCPSADDHNAFCAATQRAYLEEMAASLFTVSPKGNGIDCHKTWEAIYMRSIPIVTKSVMSIKFKEMGIPMIVIDDWSNFHELELTQLTYQCLWNNFDPTQLETMFL